jgi:hypothetical protein
VIDSSPGALPITHCHGSGAYAFPSQRTTGYRRDFTVGQFDDCCLGQLISCCGSLGCKCFGHRIFLSENGSKSGSLFLARCATGNQLNFNSSQFNDCRIGQFFSNNSSFISQDLKHLQIPFKSLQQFGYSKVQTTYRLVGVNTDCADLHALTQIGLVLRRFVLNIGMNSEDQ